MSRGDVKWRGAISGTGESQSARRTNPSSRRPIPRVGRDRRARRSFGIFAKLASDTKVIPGHGPLSTVADLQAYNAMVVESVALMRQGITAGKTLEQLKSDGLPAKWEAFGKGWITTDRWIETIYNQEDRKPKQ
jgi:hypothetical protein